MLSETFNFTHPPRFTPTADALDNIRNVSSRELPYIIYI